MLKKSSYKWSATGLVFMALLGVVFLSNIAVAERYVPSEYGTIQAAIDDCNDGDVVIIAEGTYTGNGNRDIDFLGKAITVRSTDPNDPDVVASTIIDCNGSEMDPHRGFYFHNNEDANSVLDGFTISGGYETSGGAIYCNNSSPTIRNCVIVDNSADYGGGMFNDESSPTVTNCTFIGNSAAEWGGGMTNRDCTSPIIVTNCIFTDNLASWGGGMRNASSSPTVINCTFINNTAQDWEGGGMSNRGPSNPTLINCTFSGNSSASRAGGIYVDEDSSPTITNCILWENSDAGGTDESAQIDHDGPTSVINYSCIQGWTGLLGGIDNIGDNPLFVNTANGDYHLQLSSPCIDVGDNNSVPADTTDLDGHPRIIDGDCNDTEVVDMGAYEFNYAYMGDFDYDCDVDFGDFAILGLAWLTEPPDAQWNPFCDISIPADSCIDWADLKVLTDNWLAGK